MNISLPIHGRKKKLALGVVAIALVLFTIKGCGNDQVAEQPTNRYPKVQALEITPGFTRTFRTTGSVEAEKSANFLADFTSNVESIRVSIGDEVEEGQELLVLNASEVVQDLTTANAMYTASAQNVAQARITSQRAINEAQIALKTAQINLEKLQKENAAKRIQAEETLNAANLNFGLSEASAKTALDNAIRKTQTVVRDALVDADDLLEYSPVQDGLTYVKETHLGVRDPAQKRKTVDALNDTYRHFDAFVPTYEDSISLLKEVESAMDMLLTVLYNSVNSPEYTQETINKNITDINAHLSTVRTQISSLETAKRSLDTTMQSRGGTSQVLIDAQAAYDTTIAQLDASLKRAELDVERATSAIDSAIASGRASEISALSSLTSARGTLNQATISRDKLVVVAPFSGVVTDIPVRIGRELQPGELVLAMENAKWLKVVTFVSAEEVRSINVGDIVDVADEYQARIASIAPSADPQSKKYKVELRLSGDSLLPGEFVSLSFRAKAKDNADTRIFLPVTAIHVSAADTFVWVVSQSTDTSAQSNQYTIQKRPIEIGDLAGKYIEITSGIDTGDTVVVDGGRALTREGQIVDIAL